MSSSKKFYLLESMPHVPSSGKPVYRVVSLIDIPVYGVTVGDVGGFVECEENLSHSGCCWVDEEAIVCGNARVSGDALITGHATVSGFAAVTESAVVGDRAKIDKYAFVGGRAKIGGRVHVSNSAKITGEAVMSGVKLVVSTIM